MKFRVTPELARTLKVLRVQNGISSKDVADRLAKSPSYVSKLEGGDVKYIEQASLADLLTFLTNSTNFYDEALPAVAGALQGVTSEETLPDQLWFMHYDVAARPVTLDANMTSELSQAFEALDVNSARITEHINANIDSEMPETFPANEIVTLDSGSNHRLLARVEITEVEVRAILNEPGHTTTYFFLYNVVHTMFRMQLYPQATEKLPPADATRLLRCTADYLDRWGVHSLMGFSHFVSSDAFVKRQIPMVGTEGSIVDMVAAQLHEIAEHDSMRTASQLSVWSETLAWDPGFALKLAGIPFSSLGSLSHTNKQQLLADIEKLVETYDNMDDFQKRIEQY